MHVNAVPSHATRRSFRSSRFVFVRTDLGKSKRYQSLWRVKLSIRGWHALKFALPFLVSWSCALLSNQLAAHHLYQLDVALLAFLPQLVLRIAAGI